MTDVSGIPNMGFGGGGYFGGSAALGQPAMSAAQINASMGWNPNAAQYNPWANTPGGFGGQTAYYAGLGAAYGRQVAPSSPAAVAAYYGGYPSGSVTRGADLPQPDLGGYDPLGGGGGGMVMGADGQFHYNDSAGLPQSPAPRANPYAQMYRMPAANPSYFNPGSYAGAQGNYGIPYNGRPMAGDIGYSKPPSYPNLGYNPSMQHLFANPGMGGGAFQGRFGMGFPNAGTPSQVYPGYGDSLTPMDRLGIPHLGFGGSAETGGGGA